MPSPHGVRCQSPHGQGTQSPHGVHGCGESGVPLYFAVSWTGFVQFDVINFQGGGSTFYNRIVYDTHTRIYRIDNGVVRWVATRPDIAPPAYADWDDQANNHPLVTADVESLDYNSHGLFLARKTAQNVRARDGGGTERAGYDHAVEKIAPIDGQEAAAYDSSVTFDDQVFNEDTGLYDLVPGDGDDFTGLICANRQHVFLMAEGIYTTGLRWRRFDGDLTPIEDGHYNGLLYDPENEFYTTAGGGGGSFPRVIITPEGNPRAYNIVLDRDDLTTALEHKPCIGPPSSTSVSQTGGIIAVDSNTDYVGADSPSSHANGPYISNTGANPPAVASRGTSTVGSEVLGFKGGTSGAILVGYATYPPGIVGGPVTVNFVELWELDVKTLLRDHVATLDRPALPDEPLSFRIRSVVTSGASKRIRVVGEMYTYDQADPNAQVLTHDYFAAEITRGFGETGTASVNWYVDSAYTPPGGVAIEAPQIVNHNGGLSFGYVSSAMVAASGVMGSGVDYEYTPEN